jgi:hypothetical protein
MNLKIGFQQRGRRRFKAAIQIALKVEMPAQL